MAEGLVSAEDIPHTISYAIMYRARIDSFGNLPDDKQPPRDLWDKPYRLKNFLKDIWKTDGDKKSEFIDIDEDDIE